MQPLANDRSFQKRFAAARYVNKLALSDLIRRDLEIRVDPSALFDVQVKRIHEYKRQLLNILEAVALYNAIRARPMDDWTPRVKVFAGKAAASYHQAKLIIKLIHDVAKVINSDAVEIVAAHRGGRVRRACRALGKRKIDVALVPRWARHSRRRTSSAE